ncbi:MAG: cysteine desulfurase [Candidatus Hydrogenedentota bacterium]
MRGDILTERVITTETSRQPKAQAGGALSDAEIESIRSQFPILGMVRKGRPLVYFDNAATSQKPHSVINAVKAYYESQNANVHRGVHYLSQVATAEYENARKKVQQFINAVVGCEIVFTRGATEAINLVAQSYARQRLKAGDEVLITHMEHHSNIVPWQMVCEQTGATLRVCPITDAGELDLDAFDTLLTGKVKLVALNHVSNALGTINPVKSLTEKAHAAGAVVLLDGAQALPHLKVDVQDLDCDFYVGSGHKFCGPTGIGFLFGKAPLLEAMPPYMGGGDMILSVTFEKTTYNKPPYRFEAGTPNIAGAIGMGAAIDFLESIGMDRIGSYELDLTQYGTDILGGIEGVQLIGTARNKASVLSFTMDAAHPHDIGQIFDEMGIAIRAGHHCAQPVMQRFGVPATARISLAFYNTKSELDAVAKAIDRVKEVFG